MAYVAAHNFYLPSSQSSNKISNSSFKYRHRRPYINNGSGFHRNYENSLGSWDNVSSALNSYGNFYKESQIKGSDWRKPARLSRRFSHSVETAPFILYQSTHSNLLNLNSSKYSLDSSFNNRTNSQPNIQQSVRLSQLKTINTDQYRLPIYNVVKNYNGIESNSTLHEHLPKRDLSLYSDRSYNLRNSKTFRNASEGPLTATERQNESNSFLHDSFIDGLSVRSSKYALDNLSHIDELRRGDMLKNRYQIVQEIGRGSFGNVYKAIDTDTGKFCAVKCIKHISTFQKLAQEEISILEMLSSQDTKDSFNFLHLNDHFTTADYTYMVFDLLSINLYQLVHRNNYRGFAPKLVRKFVRCILNCLHFLHRNRISHCDLKPENILLERPGYTNVKVIDFGSSCQAGQNVYAYIQSRFYRAPEVIFGCEYDTAIDMWSLGCIVVELLTGSPVFPGEDEQDQIACIMEVLGLPPPSVMRKIRRPHHFFTDEGEPRYLFERREKMESKTHHKSTLINRADPGVLTLETLLKNSMGEEGRDPLLIDFVSRCLCWDPQERITAREALRHPWVCATGVSDLNSDPASTNGVSSSSSSSNECRTWTGGTVRARRGKVLYAVNVGNQTWQCHRNYLRARFETESPGLETTPLIPSWMSSISLHLKSATELRNVNPAISKTFVRNVSGILLKGSRLILNPTNGTENVFQSYKVV